MTKYKNLSRLMGLLMCTLFSLTSPAHAEDSALPLEINADSSSCGTDLNNCTLDGNVEIIQGDASIKADRLYSKSENDWELEGNILIQKTGMSIVAENARISLEDRQLNTVRLLGSPVQFSYSLDSKDQASGQADSISFSLNNRIITLDGNAKLNEGGNELTGEHIEYDLNLEKLKANNPSGKQQGRVHMVFEPPKKNDSGN